MKQTQEITRQELITILSQVEKSTFINIVSKTKVRMNKTGNPYYDMIFKKSKSNYLIGNDYETRVNNNDKKEGGEGNFESVECSVGKHISKCVLYNEKLNTHYLMYERFDETPPQVEYEYNGNPIEKQLFESYMTKVSSTTRQPQERVVKFQTFKMDSINECTLNGTHYVVKD